MDDTDRLADILTALDAWQEEQDDGGWVYELDGEEDVVDLDLLYIETLYSPTVLDHDKDRGEVLAGFARRLARIEAKTLTCRLVASDHLQDKYRTIVPRAMMDLAWQQEPERRPPEEEPASSSMGTLTAVERERLSRLVHGASQILPKVLVEDLRCQESMLQLILCLELLSRQEPDKRNVKAKRKAKAGGAQGSRAQTTGGEVDVGTHFAILKDRLAIWQALTPLTALAITALLVHVLKPIYSQKVKEHYQELVAAFGEAPSITASAETAALELGTSPIAPKKRKKLAGATDQVASPTLRRLFAKKNVTDGRAEQGGHAASRSRKGKPKRLDVEQLRQQVEERARRAAQKSRDRRSSSFHRRAGSPTPVSKSSDQSVRLERQDDKSVKAEGDNPAHKPRPGALVRNRSLSLFKSREVSMNRRAISFDQSSTSDLKRRAGQSIGQGRLADQAKDKTTAPLQGHDGFPVEQTAALSTIPLIEMNEIRMSPRKVQRPRRLDPSTRLERTDALVISTPRISRIQSQPERAQSDMARRSLMETPSHSRTLGPTTIPASLTKAATKDSATGKSLTEALHASSSFVEPPRFSRSFEPPIFVEATPQKVKLRPLAESLSSIPLVIESTPVKAVGPEGKSM